MKPSEARLYIDSSLSLSAFWPVLAATLGAKVSIISLE